MRNRSFRAAAVVVGAAAVISACGQQRPGGGQAASTASCASLPATPIPTITPLVYPQGATSDAPRHTVLLSASDNGKSFCVKPGTGVLVLLRGTLGRKWAPIHASSHAVVPRANGGLMLALGVTGAYFVAAHPGTAVISSARPACGASSAGTASCNTKLAFRTTLVVRK